MEESQRSMQSCSMLDDGGRSGLAPAKTTVGTRIHPERKEKIKGNEEGSDCMYAWRKYLVPECSVSRNGVKNKFA